MTLTAIGAPAWVRSASGCSGTGPCSDAAATTAAQLRCVVDRLVQAGHWRHGEADIQVVMDSGYDVTRLAFVLADLPVQLVGRLRSDRVMFGPAPPCRPCPSSGRPRKHGEVFSLAEPGTWHTPDQAAACRTDRYGTARSWGRLHPCLARRGPWLDHSGELPIIEGTLVRLRVERLPGDRAPRPVWLWSSATGARPGTWTGSGGHSWTASIWSTPSACSSKLWDGPRPGCAHPRRPTGGPGWSSPPTPSCSWPGRWQQICVVPGKDPPDRVG